MQIEFVVNLSRHWVLFLYNPGFDLRDRRSFEVITEFMVVFVLPASVFVPDQSELGLPVLVPRAEEVQFFLEGEMREQSPFEQEGGERTNVRGPNHLMRLVTCI